MQSSSHSSSSLAPAEFCSVQRHSYWHDSPKLTIQPEGRRHNLPLFNVSLENFLAIAAAAAASHYVVPFMCLAFFLPSPLTSATSPPTPSILPSTPTRVAHAALRPGGERRRVRAAAAVAAVYQLHNARPSTLQRGPSLSQQQSANEPRCRRRRRRTEGLRRTNVAGVLPQKQTIAPCGSVTNTGVAAPETGLGLKTTIRVSDSEAFLRGLVSLSNWEDLGF